MASYADRFERELQKLILERIEQLKANLANGGGVESFEDYRRIVGQIAGLNEASAMCEDTRTIIEKE